MWVKLSLPHRVIHGLQFQFYNFRGAAALFTVASWLPSSKDRRGCGRWRSPSICSSVCLCYLSTLRNRILHVIAAKTKIRRNGKKFSNLKTLSVISLYPHEAGNSFPIVPNSFGSSSIENIIPESMVEGIKIIIENIEVTNLGLYNLGFSILLWSHMKTFFK